MMRSPTTLPPKTARQEAERYTLGLLAAAKDRKLAKLLNPEARDNLGRPLAPQQVPEGAAIRAALEETQSLLAAMLHEQRPADEIADQMEQNRAALAATSIT